jgi:hypothetical protein
MKRRTVYGKVSRYKLDEYLQLFDFPSPAISAEKRFATTVPQQRLFLMNSDFIQIQAEELAKMVAPEADNRARIRRAYKKIFGRDPLEDEIKLGLDYLKTEPMREYDEAKKKAEEAKADKPGGKGRQGKEGDKPAAPEVSKAEPSAPDTLGSAAPLAVEAKSEIEAPKTDAKTPTAAAAKVDAKPEAAATETAEAMPAAEPGAAMPMGMGMGMMGGMPGARRGAGGAPEVKYDASVWGRYVKILLSSSEFLFVN